MINRPSKQEVEKLSLEFAKKMIDFSNYSDDAAIGEDVIKRATNMAIEWLEGVDLRSKMYEQQCANWVDLAEIDISIFNLDTNKKYWFMAREYATTNPLKLVHAKFIKSVKADVKVAGEPDTRYVTLADIQDDENIEYIAQYIIPEKDGVIFNKEFKPLVPKNLRVEE